MNRAGHQHVERRPRPQSHPLAVRPQPHQSSRIPSRHPTGERGGVIAIGRIRGYQPRHTGHAAGAPDRNRERYARSFSSSRRGRDVAGSTGTRTVAAVAAVAPATVTRYSTVIDALPNLDTPMDTVTGRSNPIARL